MDQAHDSEIGSIKKKKKITIAKTKLIYTNVQKRKRIGSENLNGELKDMIWIKENVFGAHFSQLLNKK